MKACSLDAEQLKAWAREQTGVDPSGCVGCLVTDESCQADQPVHLTKLDQEILAFVLEVVMLHLDEGSGAYWLNVAMVAKCLDKTPAQLSAAIGRLVVDGLLIVTEKWKPGEPIPTKCGMLPTVLAMKTLAAYQSQSDEAIEAEIRTLAGETGS